MKLGYLKTEDFHFVWFIKEKKLIPVQLFLGHFFMLEDCQASKRPVKLKEPDFARELEKTSL